MSKKSAKPAGPVTRRQQVAAIRQVKGDEIAEAVGEKIREAVKDEVERQLKTITATMLDCIDRVIDLEVASERDSNDRQSGAEAVAVQQDAQVVPQPWEHQPDCGCEDGNPSPRCGRLLSEGRS